jgi:hypothetical protein
VRRIKLIGLATVAAFALSAVAAALALASSNGEFSAQHYSGEEAQEHAATTNLNGFNAGGAVSICEEGHFNTGEELAVFPSGPSHELTVHPTYGKCKVGLSGVNYAAKVTTTGCNYRFHDTTADSTTEAVDVVCSEGHKIKVELEGAAACHIEVGSQSGLKDVTYENKGTGSAATVEVKANVTGIAYESNCKGIATSGSNAEYKEGVFNKTTGLAELTSEPAKALAEGTYEGGANGVFA